MSTIHIGVGDVVVEYARLFIYMYIYIYTYICIYVYRCIRCNRRYTRPRVLIRLAHTRPVSSSVCTHPHSARPLAPASSWHEGIVDTVQPPVRPTGRMLPVSGPIPSSLPNGHGSSRCSRGKSGTRSFSRRRSLIGGYQHHRSQILTARFQSGHGTRCDAHVRCDVFICT